MPAKRQNKKQQKLAAEIATATTEAKQVLAALKDGESQVDALKKLGNACFVGLKYEQAIHHFTSALALDEVTESGMEHIIFSNRSACNVKLGKFDEAVDDARQCVTLKSEWTKGYCRLGEALMRQGDLYAAQNIFNQGLEHDATNADLLAGVSEVRTIIRKKLEKNERAGKEFDLAEMTGGKKKTKEEIKEEKSNKYGVDMDSLGEYVIGIDLGTTFSCVAVWKDGKPVVLENADGQRTTPSWVSFTDEERLVGHQAKNQAANNHKRTLFNIKRIIGRQFNECREDINLMPFHVRPGRGGKPVVEVDTKGNGKVSSFAPEQISAMVLERMKQTAEEALGCKITKAVVTVPAYFNDSQRRLTKDAGKIAGLDILRIINEPTAAALAYGLDKKDKSTKNVLVFDLGGGTFDVSLLKIEDGVFQVLATAGDTHLGGEDFDTALVEWAISQLRKDNNGDDPLKGCKKKMRKLRAACEKAKVALSQASSTTIDIYLNDKEVEIPVTRKQFEHLNEKIFQRCMDSVKRVLSDSKVEQQQVDDIVLVGGSTRVPRIREILSEYFGGKELCHSVHPDEAVAYGAAVQGAILSGVRDPLTKSLLLVDVTPLSLGVECQGKQFAKVLPRNSSIPTKKSSEFTTVADYQTSIDIRVFEGERAHCDGNHLLGEFTINGIERAKKGEAKIDVTFEVNSNGILTVSAFDKITGASANVEIEHDRGRLNSDEIEKMCLDAAMMRDADQTLIAAREKMAGMSVGGAADDDDW